MAFVISLLLLNRLKACKVVSLVFIKCKIFSFSRPASPSIAASCLLQGVTLLLGVFFRVCRMSRKTSSVYGFVVTGTAKVSKSSLETASSPMSQSDFVSAVRSSLEY